MNKGISANEFIIQAITEKLNTSKDKPTKEEPEPVTTKATAPKENTVANTRKGEPTQEHIIAAMFLQRKHHPKGILSNGQCLRRELPNGEFQHKYFAEEFTKEEAF